MNKEYIVMTILPNTTKKEQELINSSLLKYFSEGFKIEDKIVSPFLVIIILSKIIKWISTNIMH